MEKKLPRRAKTEFRSARRRRVYGSVLLIREKHRNIEIGRETGTYTYIDIHTYIYIYMSVLRMRTIVPLSVFPFFCSAQIEFNVPRIIKKPFIKLG